VGNFPELFVLGTKIQNMQSIESVHVIFVQHTYLEVIIRQPTRKLVI